MIRVLVAEGSATIREYLISLLRQDPAFEVVGESPDGESAVVLAERLRPDIILMDIYMPRKNGYEATRQIMQRAPAPIVMITASTSHGEMAITFDALKAGAVTLLTKPGGPDHPDNGVQTRRLLETLKLMSEVKVVRRHSRDQVVTRPTYIPITDQKIEVVAIGASTGGPQVLGEILAGLPADFQVPILIVQHIVNGFTIGMCEWLGKQTRLPVKVASQRESVRPGIIYIAPEKFQMGITRLGEITLTDDPPENGFRPSVSYLFRSAAASYGRAAMGILLTGMGSDGALGLQSLQKAGGTTIAQDEASSAIFGMPREAVRLGAAELLLPPYRILEVIKGITATSFRRKRT